MLLQLLANHPEAIGPILRKTPIWVWGLFAGLVAVGISQLRARTASLARVSVLPVAMTLFSIWGTFSVAGGAPHLAGAAAAWLIAGGLAFALVAPGQAAAEFDPVQRSYRLPGSAIPLLLIVGIFLVKYVVGVELAMAPRLAGETRYVLVVAALYGAFTGVFVGRAARLWRLAWRPATAGAAA
jgi:hypothetical protein